MANATDAFTEASDTQLESHTDDQGNSWSFPVGSTDGIVIASTDHAENEGTDVDAFAQNSVTPASADGDCEVDINQNGGSNFGGPLIRYDSAGGGDGYGSWYRNSTGNYRLDRLDNLTPTQLGSASGSAGGNIRLNGNGSTLTLYQDDVELFNVSDSTYTAAAKPGLRLRTFSSTQPTYDNWAWTDAAGGGTRPVKMAGHWGGYAGSSGGFVG